MSAFDNVQSGKTIPFTEWMEESENVPNLELRL